MIDSIQINFKNLYDKFIDNKSLNPQKKRDLTILYKNIIRELNQEYTSYVDKKSPYDMFSSRELQTKMFEKNSNILYNRLQTLTYEVNPILEEMEEKQNIELKQEEYNKTVKNNIDIIYNSNDTYALINSNDTELIKLLQ